MPILKNAKTVWVDDNPWSSPDGKVTIWKIKLEVDGTRELHSTMSKALATEGYTGDVELYTNDKGKDYVRQAPKEDSTASTWGAESPERQESINRSVALNNAVALCAQDGRMKDKDTVLDIADRFLEWLKTGETKPTYQGKDREEPDPQWSEPLPNYPEEY